MKKNNQNLTGLKKFARRIQAWFTMKKNNRNLIVPKNFVGRIPAGFTVFLVLLVIGGLYHVYFKYDGNTGKQVTFGNLNVAEKIDITIDVSLKGKDTVSEKYKFVKRIQVRDDDKAKDRQNEKKFYVWESVPTFNDKLSKVSKDIETLSCENRKKGDIWSEDKTRKTNAWCSLIGKSLNADGKTKIRYLLNKNDEIEIKDKNGEPTGKYYDFGSKELFDLPYYDFWKGLNGFRPNEKESFDKGKRRISENGEYTLSIYPSVQEGMFQFMSDNDMIGTVFAYRPSNGDIYCMASAPGWTERKQKRVPTETTKYLREKDGLYRAIETELKWYPKEGAQMQGNFYPYTPGSTMKPLTLLIYRDQKSDLESLTIEVKGEDKTWLPRDSHYAIDDTVLVGKDRVPKASNTKAIHCTGTHTGNKSVKDGLGNSCNSFFAKLAEKLDFKKAQKTLEAMDFHVELYKDRSTEGREHDLTIDNIPYNQSVFPFKEGMKYTKDNLENFIGQGNLLVSPIDMAVWTALFGKLSKDKNSKVYFPRIWLPADETKRNEGSPEFLLTEKNPAENEHIAKLSDFVSTRKDAIADVGRIWKAAYLKHYRKDLSPETSGACRYSPASCHLDGDGLTSWSQWIDMAKTGTVERRKDITDPRFKECIKFKCLEENNGECVKFDNKCGKEYEPKENRNQRTLSLYSEELDLAAYIVIENYGTTKGSQEKIHTPSKIKLDSTAMMLTKLVAKALGKELDDVKPSKNEKSKKEKEEEQWKNLRQKGDVKIYENRL